MAESQGEVVVPASDIVTDGKESASGQQDKDIAKPQVIHSTEKGSAETGITNSTVSVNPSRPQREKTLSLVAKESKTTETKLAIVKLINFEFRFLHDIQCEDFCNDTVNNLTTKLDTCDLNALKVHELYNTLNVLCESDIDKPISDMYEQYNTTLNLVKDSLQQRNAELEQRKLSEAEKFIQRANVELEEQMKIYMDFMKFKQDNLTTRQQNVDGIRTTSSEGQPRTCTDNENQPLPLEQHCLATYAKPRDTSRDTEQSIANGKTSDLETKQLFIETLEAVRNSSRTSVEPAVFDGNVLEFYDWEVDLDTYLRNERINGHERLRHLKKYVGGDVRKCIEGYFLVNTNEAYLKARDTLRERYGNERDIVRSFRKKLEEWPKIQGKDGKGLREFSDYLCHLQSAMVSIKRLKSLNEDSENEKIVQKLPEWLRMKWAQVVSRTEQTEDRYPSFYEFSNFIKNEAHVLSLPVAQSFATIPNHREKDFKPSRRTTKSYLSSTSEIHRCLFCEQAGHKAADCRKLSTQSKENITKFKLENGLCFRCLLKGHRSKGCYTKLECSVCHKPHATVSHDPHWKDNNTKRVNKMGKEETSKENLNSRTMDNRAEPKQLQVNSTEVGHNSTSMAIPVYVSGSDGREMLVYALLDNQSDGCFISKEVIDTLNLEVDEVEPVIIITITGKEASDENRYDNIFLRGYSTTNTAKISAYERKEIVCSRDQLPNPSKARRFEHLRCISDKMSPLLDIPVGLLIGNNFPEVIQPLQTKPTTQQGQPYGARTLFGWTMCGGSNKCKNVERNVFKVDIRKDTELVKLLERDFKDISNHNSSAPISQNDLKFLETLEQATSQNEKGNYVMPLPFKGKPNLPNNKHQAEKRLQQLLKRMKGDEEYQREYFTFMSSLLDSEHAEEIPDDEVMKNSDVWYLPHFGVRHPKKRKLRIVFDASAKCGGLSLNDNLLTGPDHINSLLGILIRFRREPIAISCDIEKMFYNFLVKPEHRDYLRFLWTDETKTVQKEYRMKVHLFGATSSPAIATYGLRKVAEDYKSISPRASEFLHSDFYVDDGVTSVATSDEAKKLIEGSTEICRKGNIRLHKFLSNDKEVLGAVPSSERSESTKNLDIFNDQLPSERTLGMEWCLESDSFHFKTPNSLNKPTTKRGILSMVAQIYDPMGLISPVVLKGKQVLQRVIATQKGWDQLVPPNIESQWKSWLTNLTRLENLHIPRCFKVHGTITGLELHHFSDASFTGYGACTYLRQIKDNGTVNCHLILSKARVAPLKPVTIPRLELQGAVVATRLARTLRNELKMEINREFFWTDSRITLGYISNDAKRFHVYVANRVQEIRQTTTPDQWNYVNTKENPADLTSRGADAEDLHDPLWLFGPRFLQNADITDYTKQNRIENMIEHDDPELRKVSTFSTSTIKRVGIAAKFNKFSSWKSLIRGIAALKTFAKLKKEKKTWNHGKLQPFDLSDAETFIIQSVQSEYYPNNEKHKSLIKLHPWKDTKGIIRIGGRLHAAAELHHLQKHPIIIPYGSHLAELISRHFHEKVFHLGRRTTLASIRDAGYWLISGSKQINQIISKCVSCARLRKSTSDQLMGQLPPERAEKTPPFTHVGLDVFGHFTVKDRRSEIKRWGLLVTCLYSRAIHTELLMDLSTDSFINSLRRVMAIRGPINTIFCDNGTNFSGAKNEFQRLTERADDQLKDFLLEGRIEFKMNSPDSSHQGGSWERLIRSVRTVLNGMSLKFKSRLDTDALQTALYEAANIVNSRPLPATGENDETIITPNHLLTMKTKPLVAPPPGTFLREDVYGKKRWMIAQRFAEEFWTAWRSDYVQQLQVRQKWTKSHNNISVGDVVIIKDTNEPRNCWKLAIVTDTFPGTDGLVRKVELRLANRNLDRKGIPMSSATVLKRPIQKLVVLIKV